MELEPTTLCSYRTSPSTAGKPRGLQAARSLRTSRRENRWADKAYKKRALGNIYKTSPTGGSSHAKGIVLEKVSFEKCVERGEVSGMEGKSGRSWMGEMNVQDCEPRSTARERGVEAAANSLKTGRCRSQAAQLRYPKVCSSPAHQER